MNFTIVIIIIIVIIVFWFIGSYNGFISLRNRFKEAFSTMDVYLQKRYDLIPNLVETVKGYAKHEKSTFEDITNARSRVASAQGIDDKIAAENELTQTLGHLFAVAENYPDLKANTNFLELQASLNNIETEIAQSRKYYNAVVKAYNTRVQSFPSNIIAKIFHFETQEMFALENKEARENVKVEF